jgi:serine/threonine protein kinase
MKPSNVLVDPTIGLVQICDLGSAKKLSKSVYLLKIYSNYK